MEQNIGHWIHEVTNGRRPGYALVLTGPQGCGKSTLSRTLAATCKKALIDSHRAPAVTVNAILRYDADYGLDYDSIKNRITSDNGPIGIIIETCRPLDIGPADRRFLVVELPRVCHPEQRDGSEILAEFMAGAGVMFPPGATEAEVVRVHDDNRVLIDFFEGRVRIRDHRYVTPPRLAAVPVKDGDVTTLHQWTEAMTSTATPVSFLQPAMNAAVVTAAKAIRNAAKNTAPSPPCPASRAEDDAAKPPTSAPAGYILSGDGYMGLAHVLQRAFDQSAKGKGKTRHTTHDGQAFEDQPICELQRLYGPGYAYGQVGKKMEEAQRLPRDQAVAELLGGIVYLAAAVIVLEESD